MLLRPAVVLLPTFVLPAARIAHHAGSGLRTVVDALCTDLIAPVLSTVFGAGDGDALSSLRVNVFGVDFLYGARW